MKRTRLPLERAVGTPQSTSRPQARISALALAAAIALGVATSDAQALALGRVTVQSALGEPLRVDIEIPEITDEEVASLRARGVSVSVRKSKGRQIDAACGQLRRRLESAPVARGAPLMT